MTVSNYANGIETVLTSAPGVTGLTFNVQSTDNMASPMWLVVDPYDNAKREYIYFDGTFTATALVTTSIVNRYGDGSAAVSNIDHEEGAIVLGALTKQLLDEIVAEIDTKSPLVHDHDPSGGAPLSHYVKEVAGELDTYSEKIVTANTGAAYSVDLSVAQHFNLTLTANSTLSFTNWPSGRLGTVNLRLKQDGTGSRTVTWPSGILWPGGLEPTLSTAASAIDNFVIRSWDGGTTVEGFLVGQAMGAA